jgi:hypothetical protein
MSWPYLLDIHDGLNDTLDGVIIVLGVFFLWGVYSSRRMFLYAMTVVILAGLGKAALPSKAYIQKQITPCECGAKK